MPIGYMMHDRDQDTVLPVVSCAALAYRPVSAYTMSDENKFHQIQFCPWFLDYAMRKGNFQFTNSITGIVKRALVRYVGRPFGKAFFMTKMDAISMFDKVILHELTHARNEGDNIIDTEDVGGPGNAYGWKNCRALSQVQTDLSQTPQILGPEHNADTYALFGSACLLYRGGLDGVPLDIFEDGSFAIVKTRKRAARGKPQRIGQESE